MEKKLPSVYVNEAAKNITSNNKKIYYSHEDKNKKNEENELTKKVNFLSIRKQINDIFNSPEFVYKAKVLITTKEDGTFKDNLISKNLNEVITINNKRILYEDIISIKKI